MKAVFDASVLMAILQDEPGADMGVQLLSNAAISIVNYAETTTNLGRRGASASALERALKPFEQNVVALTKDISLKAGLLAGEASHLSLSLGDRVCIATGLALKLTILTADRAWAELDLPVPIKLIR